MKSYPQPVQYRLTHLMNSSSEITNGGQDNLYRHHASRRLTSSVALLGFAARKTLLGILPLTLLALTGGTTAVAQDARFFRIAGPVPITITSVSPDGTVTWTNTATNATFTIQTATALPGAGNFDWVAWVQVPTSNTVTALRMFDPNPPGDLAFIPAGSYTMGDALDGLVTALPLRTVQISGFYMDRYEVTLRLWHEVYTWAITNGYSFEHGAQGKADLHPAHTMTWYDAAKWCNARSEREGRTPAYYTSAAQTTVYRTGQVSLQSDWVKWNAGYRLPTEGEWEKAVRGGKSEQRFPWGNTITHGHANYNSNAGYGYDTSPTRGYHPVFAAQSAPYTSPVGSFEANGYGLHDLLGNVSEWCWDWWSVAYDDSSPTSDPRGPATGADRVIRGGSWGDFAFFCRSAYRLDYSPGNRHSFIGFRTVRSADQ